MRTDIWEPTERDIEEIRAWFARRPFLRSGMGAVVISGEEYVALSTGIQLPAYRIRDLRAFIDGYERAK